MKIMFDLKTALSDNFELKELRTPYFKYYKLSVSIDGCNIIRDYYGEDNSFSNAPKIQYYLGFFENQSFVKCDILNYFDINTICFEVV